MQNSKSEILKKQSNLGGNKECVRKSSLCAGYSTNESLGVRSNLRLHKILTKYSDYRKSSKPTRNERIDPTKENSRSLRDLYKSD